MNSSGGMTQRSTWRTTAAIFAVAVAFNYVWEVAQSPLYAGMEDLRRMLWHCFAPSLGDGGARAAHFCSRLVRAALARLVRTTGYARLRSDAYCRIGNRHRC